jgi:hypothetical protein
MDKPVGPITHAPCPPSPTHAVLLGGSHPFEEDDDEARTFENIRTASCRLKKSVWKNVSEDAKVRQPCAVRRGQQVLKGSTYSC